MDIVFTTSQFSELFQKKSIWHNSKKLKTEHIIHLIDNFLNRYKIYTKDNIRLNSRNLKLLYGSNYSQIIDYLSFVNFFYLYKNYSVGQKSKCYKLTKEIKDQQVMAIRYDFSETLMEKEKLIMMRDTPIRNLVVAKTVENLFKIDIDHDLAKSWIENNILEQDQKRDINLKCISKINSKKIHYCWDKWGRLHTNYTNLKKEIRTNFLRIDGSCVCEIDITNSQPFFLYLLLKKNGFTDFNGYDNDVLDGTLYTKLKEVWGTDRKTAKVKVYSVLFGRNMDNVLNKAFRDLYPGVYRFIIGYKEAHKSYKALAQELQKIESDFVFNNVVAKLISERPNLVYTTIHDSILIKCADYDWACTIFDDCKAELVK